MQLDPCQTITDETKFVQEQEDRISAFESRRESFSPETRKWVEWWLFERPQSQLRRYKELKELEG